MAKHNVYVDLPTREISKVDAYFYIYRDNVKLGQITISKGGFEYYPSNSRNPLQLNWSQFDRAMRELRKG